MEKELKTTDDSFFIMKWGKFISLIAGIVIATNFITGFMVSSEYADAQSKHHDSEVEKEKEYNEARDKRRLARTLQDAKTHVKILFLEKEVIDLTKELKQCKNQK